MTGGGERMARSRERMTHGGQWMTHAGQWMTHGRQWMTHGGQWMTHGVSKMAFLAKKTDNRLLITIIFMKGFDDGRLHSRK